MRDTTQPVNRLADPAAVPFKRPRFVVSKLLFVLLLAYLATTVAAFFLWRSHTRAQLQAAKDAVHARGEPVSLAEITFFRQGQLPPERNAFTLYQQAAAALEALPAEVLFPSTNRYARASASASVDLLYDYPAWRREHADETAAFLNACQPALDLIRQARGMDGVPPLGTFYDDRPSPMDMFMLDPFYTHQLAKLSHVAAVIAHDVGDDREAFEHLRDILQLGDLVGEHPTLTTSSVQVAITTLAAECIEHLLPTLKIGDSPDEVPLADIRELAEQLMTSERLLDVARKAMISERVFNYEMLRSIWEMGEPRGTHDAAPGIRTMAIHIWRDLNLTASLRYYSIHYPAERATGRYSPTYSIAMEDQEWLQRLDIDNVNQWSWSYAKGVVYFPFIGSVLSLDKSYVGVYQGLASQRMAGLALLMRAYEVETGQPVETLDDLVPRYLAALPEDPFSPTGDPPRYLPDDPHPRLYSLNNNQQDDGGDYGAKKPRNSQEAKDWPLFLNGTRFQAEGRDEQPPEPSRGW